MRTIGPSRDVAPFVVALFAAAVFALLPISTDLYLPSLPGLRRDLGISDAQSQLTLSAFVIGFGIAQLVYGPLSDRFGRRPVLLGGILVYIAASLICVASPSIYVLVLGRAVQGVGACSGQVMARAIVRDLYEPRQGARVLAVMTYLFALIPLCAPIIGGHLTVWFNWRANFAFLASFAVLILFITWRKLDETNLHPDESATRAGRFIANARTILANRTFVGYGLVYVATYCALFSYLSTSSFILLDVLGVRPEHFGYWFMLGVGGNILGAFACAPLTHRIALPRLLVAGASLSFAGGVLMFTLAWHGVAHPAAIMLPMMLYMIGHGIVTPVCLAAAVGPFPKMAGTASALLGFSQFAFAAIAGQIAIRMLDGTTLPLGIAVAVFATCVLVSALSVARIPG